MNGLAASEAVARAHAPLVQRAAAILGSGVGHSASSLRGKGEAAAPGPGPSVMIERGSINRLEREGQRGRLALTYRDPAGDAPLAALP